MSPEENKAIARRHLEENWNQGNLDSVNDIFAADCVFHFSRGAMARGTEALKNGISGLRKALPDIHITIEDIFAEGDKVAMRWTAQATHTGEINLGRTISPTGKQVTFFGSEIHHLRDGKIVESWRNWDRLGLAQQLGLNL